MENPVDLALGNAEERNNEFLFMSRSDVTKYRVTGIQTAEKCGTLWTATFLSPDGVTPPVSTSNVYTIIGSLCHLYVEDFIYALWKNPDHPCILDEADKQRILKEIEERGNAIPNSPNSGTKTVYNLQQYKMRLMMNIAGHEIISVEQDFNIKNDHINLGGHADLILRNKATGRYVCLDHKTNRRPSPNHKWRAKFQIQAHAEAVCNFYGVDEIDFIIGNINLDEDNTFAVKSSAYMLNMRIAGALRNIDTGYRSVGEHCYGCKIKDECETHKKKGSADGDFFVIDR